MNNVTYVDVSFIKTDDGRIYAGVELKRKDDGVYTVYHVISYAAGVNIPSIKRLVPILLRYTLDFVDSSHDVVIFRSFSRAFQRSTGYEQEISAGQQRTIKLVYVPYPQFMRNHRINTVLLAEDAIRRGYTLDAVI